MKKKITIVLILLGLIVITIGIITYLNYREKKKQVLMDARKIRYNEIRESLAKAVEQNIKATFVIKNEYNCTHYVGKIHTAKSLISNGNLKQEEMLDVDGKSYCKAYIETFMGENCNPDYKIYLSCKDYQDKGYVNWG